MSTQEKTIAAYEHIILPTCEAIKELQQLLDAEGVAEDIYIESIIEELLRVACDDLEREDLDKEEFAINAIHASRSSQEEELDSKLMERLVPVTVRVFEFLMEQAEVHGLVNKAAEFLEDNRYFLFNVNEILPNGTILVDIDVEFIDDAEPSDPDDEINATMEE